MKKTLIASAVAAAALSSNAFAMDHASDLAEKLDSMPTIYGNIQVAHFWNEAEDAAGNTIDADSSHGFDDGGSTIGFKHEHEISEGLTGFFKAEFEFDADDKNGNGGLSGFDEAFIGVKGSFGAVQVGSDDTVYESMINITDTSEQIGLGANFSGVDSTGNDLSNEGDNVQYVGEFDAITVGLTHAIDNTDRTFGTQVAAKFSADMFSVAAAYHMARDAKDGTKGQDAIGVAAELYVDDLTVQLQYETLDESDSGTNDGGDYTAVQALYNMGAATFAAGYGLYGTDSTAATADDESVIYLQALYNVSDNMYVYLEANMADNYDQTKDQENTATAIGATYYF